MVPFVIHERVASAARATSADRCPAKFRNKIKRIEQLCVFSGACIEPRKAAN
jgi:hypothetical protein